VSPHRDENLNEPPLHQTISNATISFEHDNQDETIFPTGCQDEPLSATDAFGVPFYVPHTRARTHDWVCDNFSSDSKATLDPLALALPFFGLAASCPLCDEAPNANSCPTRFSEGWPAISIDRIITVQNDTSETLRCRICQSAFHAAPNCPSWQSDLLRYHELSFGLYKEETPSEYEYAQLLIADAARIPSRFTPIRDELQTRIYSGSHYSPTQFLPDDLEEGKRKYFERYRTALDVTTRRIAHHNLKNTYDLLLEWTTRQLQRLRPSWHPTRKPSK
jgi:hypothetical protein